MKLALLSEHLKNIALAQERATEHMDESIQSVLNAYVVFADAHQLSSELQNGGALTGHSLTELTALSERLGTVRELLAEIACVLGSLHATPEEWDDELKTVAKAARHAMAEKRMAKWEDDALKGVVVTALAGDEPKKAKR